MSGKLYRLVELTVEYRSNILATHVIDQTGLPLHEISLMGFDLTVFIR